MTLSTVARYEIPMRFLIPNPINTKPTTQKKIRFARTPSTIICGKSLDSIL